MLRPLSRFVLRAGLQPGGWSTARRTLIAFDRSVHDQITAVDAELQDTERRVAAVERKLEGKAPRRDYETIPVLLQERTALWTKDRQLREEKLLLLQPSGAPLPAVAPPRKSAVTSPPPTPVESAVTAAPKGAPQEAAVGKPVPAREQPSGAPLPKTPAAPTPPPTPSNPAATAAAPDRATPKAAPEARGPPHSPPLPAVPPPPTPPPSEPTVATAGPDASPAPPTPPAPTATATAFAGITAAFQKLLCSDPSAHLIPRLRFDAVAAAAAAPDPEITQKAAACGLPTGEPFTKTAAEPTSPPDAGDAALLKWLALGRTLFAAPEAPGPAPPGWSPYRGCCPGWWGPRQAWPGPVAGMVGAQCPYAAPPPMPPPAVSILDGGSASPAPAPPAPEVVQTLAQLLKALGHALEAHDPPTAPPAGGPDARATANAAPDPGSNAPASKIVDEGAAADPLRPKAAPPQPPRSPHPAASRADVPPPPPPPPPPHSEEKVHAGPRVTIHDSTGPDGWARPIVTMKWGGSGSNFHSILGTVAQDLDKELPKDFLGTVAEAFKAAAGSVPQPPSPPPAPLRREEAAALPVAELKKRLAALGVSTTGVVEKAELVDLLVKAARPKA